MEFQRFVSYVYEYHGREKGENCGFVKAEVRREQVRLLVHMYLPGKQGVEYQVYGCLRRGGHVDGILMGKGNVKNGNVDIRLQLPEEDMTLLYRGEHGYAGKGVSFAELSGIIVRASDKQVYGTVWDDDELDVMAFAEWKPQDNAEAEEAGKINAKETETETGKAEAGETNAGKAELGTRNVGSINVNRESEWTQRNVDAKEAEMKEDSRQNRQNGEEGSRIEETGRQINIQEMLPEDSIWQQLREQCVAMSPFEAQPNREFFRIEPRQLGLLPRQCWQLGRNSFLLHGYYNYRYLIVGKEGDSVLIGVPGTYSFMEEACAAMFGFVFFYPAQGRHKEQGRFGYWCRQIPLSREGKAGNGITRD